MLGKASLFETTITKHSFAQLSVKGEERFFGAFNLRCQSLLVCSRCPGIIGTKRSKVGLLFGYLVFHSHAPQISPTGI